MGRSACLKILFTDEAHFQLNGQVNSHNTRYISTTKPPVRATRQQGSPHLTVYCGMSGRHLIGPFFINGAINQHVICDLLDREVFPAIDGLPQGDIVTFQQDGASSHTANRTLAKLRAKFGTNIIFRRTPTLGQAGPLISHR